MTQSTDNENEPQPGATIEEPSATRTHTVDTRNPDWAAYVPDGHGHTDEQIRADVHELLMAESGDTRCSLSISVCRGIVTLDGEVWHSAEQRRLVEGIRAIPSVLGVESHLRVVAPASKLSH